MPNSIPITPYEQQRSAHTVTGGAERGNDGQDPIDQSISAEQDDQNSEDEARPEERRQSKEDGDEATKHQHPPAGGMVAGRWLRIRTPHDPLLFCRFLKRTGYSAQVKFQLAM